jgi:hypothetical protein
MIVQKPKIQAFVMLRRPLIQVFASRQPVPKTRAPALHGEDGQGKLLK